MIVIGICGGVASGKSFVAQGLEQLGAERLDADRAGHEVLCQAEVEQALGRRWGRRVLDRSGHVDRAALGRIVFAPPPDGPAELAYLEQLTHPRIGRRLQERIAQLAAAGKTKAVVLDAPVMFKAGWDRFCDRIIFVDAPRQLRLARARRRGWSEAEFAARETAQRSLSAKRQRADIVIDNAGTREQTLAQLRRFWRSLD